MRQERKAAVTIYDIAREANVSPSTVSRVLNGSTPVAEHKQAAVMAAIERLNFRPNVVAQGLARGKTMIVGVLTQDIASPFYGEILKSIEQSLHSTGYYPVFASSNWGPDEELDALKLLVERRVDGLVILGGQIYDVHLAKIGQEVPLVAVGRSISGHEANCIYVDNFEGSYRATRYLIELGHTRIAHITGLFTAIDAIERYRGYCQALVDAGLEVDSNLIVEGNFTEQSGLMAIEVLLQRGAVFSAVVVANDQMAYGARLALFRRGIRVPEDISLVGFDDQPNSAYTTPPLTTIRQPAGEMGRAAVQSILYLIKLEQENREAPLVLPKAQTFGTELVIRESAIMSRQSRLPVAPASERRPSAG